MKRNDVIILYTSTIPAAALKKNNAPNAWQAQLFFTLFEGAVTRHRLPSSTSACSNKTTGNENTTKKDALRGSYSKPIDDERRKAPQQ
jgi:hypothetical protein